MKSLFSALLFVSIFAVAASAQTALAAAQNGIAAAPGQAGAPSGQAVPDWTANAPSANDLTVVVNNSIVLERGTELRRISISNPDIAEAVAVSATEVLINGKSAGDTTLILWDAKGERVRYEVHVVPDNSKFDIVRNQLLKEVGPAASLTIEDGNVFLRGTVADITLADRAAAIAATLGKVVNLLRVVVPPGAPQILLKVRFANVSRSASAQLGFNFFSGNQKGIGTTTTAQFGQNPTGLIGGTTGQGLNLTDLLNIFYFRPDLNIGAVLQALEAKSLAQTLAEPNLLTVSGTPASFLAGGEFPFPTIQGGAAGVGQITIQFKEYGIRLNFLPVVTPRGTIQLQVTPEVSSLDYTNGLTVSGYTVPGLATRRVQTEVELQNGQSFVIAGLLDNELTQQFDKIPGIASVPVLGKLFQSRSLTRNNDELLVLVTPEIVGPIPGGVKPPSVNMPMPFLKDGVHPPPQNPGPDTTGPLEPLPMVNSLPVEELKSIQQSSAGNAGAPSSSGTPPASTSEPPLVPGTPAAPSSTSGNAASPGSSH